MAETWKQLGFLNEDEQIKTADLLFKQYDANAWQARDDTDSSYASIVAATQWAVTAFGALANNVEINAFNSDDYVMIFKARDTGVGLAEVGRLVGAADPYFALGGTYQWKFYNSGTADFNGTPISGVKDENDMASDSDTHLATQQSIKAYVDAASGGGVATGTYTGDNSNNRQITVGFICKTVFINGGLVYSTYQGNGILAPNCATRNMVTVGSGTTVDNGMKCHATDGFIVGSAGGANYYFNISGQTYNWIGIE